MSIETYSPVVMFVHTRLDHTSRTIESLSNCTYSEKTDLIIYSDGARNLSEQIEVDKVRSFLYTLDGFRSVQVVERDYNFGLAKNIFKGVTEVLEQYPSTIVLEDDMELSRSFLQFMNLNLMRYQHDDSIWQVSGWSPDLSDEYNAENISVFKSQLMPCWGWATWADRWQQRIEDPLTLISEFSLRKKIEFNLGMSYPFYSHLVGNAIGRNSTWAIFWYASAFLKQGRSVCPTCSLVLNIGSDGSGSHAPIGIKQRKLIEHSITKYNAVEPSVNESINSRIMSIYSSGLSIKQRISMYIKVLLPNSIWSMLS